MVPPQILMNFVIAFHTTHPSFENTFTIFSADEHMRSIARMTTIPLRLIISAFFEKGDCLAARCILMVRGLPISESYLLCSSKYDLISARLTGESGGHLITRLSNPCFCFLLELSLKISSSLRVSMQPSHFSNSCS